MTHDGVTLHGIDNGVDSDLFILHIHGKFGNFYQNSFIADMCDGYARANIRFAAFNHRAHDGLTENYLPNGIIYTGAAVEKIADVRSDIACLHEFAASQAARVVMQGHSQGCEYVFWDAIGRAPPIEIVLLSPSDSRAIQQQWRHGEDPAAQAHRLRGSYDLVGHEWLPSEEYGVRSTYDYEIPVTTRSLIDILESVQLATFSFDRSWTLPKVQGRCFAYVGGADPLRMHTLEETEAGLRKRFEHLRFYSIKGGNHHFREHEDEVIGAIVQWLLAG
jgi:hypothetical protein